MQSLAFRWSALAAVAVLVLAAAVATWLHRPLPLRLQGQPVVDVVIEPGMSAAEVAESLVASGVDTTAWGLFLWFRLSGQSRALKAGSYELAPGTTPATLLDKLVRGEQAVRRLTLVEGWNVRQVLQAVRTAEYLIDDLPAGDDPVELARHLGLRIAHAEGRFFPDTYVYPKRTPASRVLRQAAAAMEKRLADAWAQRHSGLPLRSPDEALILASIIEKETGREADRPLVAAVFINRLRIGMRLQSDPTVIYGLGEGFDGDLRRRDLVADTAYNTYTRAGLPPTPIAMPGWNSLLAAVQPASSRALYFVARGDGSSAFSHTLEEHHQAVRRYQIGR
ncbi:MAG: endolytic transglycosylase MltG [Tepidimonas sp.]|uniref:endolytic transglycosylase MltG n=1 Tax=Tepidimonas sp. TaxID=2002775 RepID=UPI00259D62E4|nr:endolytic transglycosylase MltG [Tepidimonas sp.]MDM7457680.1 endolytic transglycosylase MltG [Tepidimonas sp.]